MEKEKNALTLVGLELVTSGWEPRVLTIRPMDSCQLLLLLFYTLGLLGIGEENYSAESIPISRPTCNGMSSMLQLHYQHAMYT